MDSRRAFLKKGALLAGIAGVESLMPDAVFRAMGISPEPGSTFYDAEHVVFLMQENRSFDHMFGTLQGVRGFNDPHPHIQPDGNSVWLQKDNAGYTYAPFHVNINKTKITWQGGLPHSWNDQVAARNGGKYDKWLPAKAPMTLSYYDRKDIPFYYALADAFTVCDQHFCSSLTGTTPNRLFFFTGTIRGEKSENPVAVVNNEQAESQQNTFVDWPTFQEVLEDNGIDWRVYQNELWTSRLPEGEIDDWLGNYGDNPLEYISRHHVKLSSYFREHGDHTVDPPLSPKEVQARYDKLSEREKNLVDKAFTTNHKQKDYLELEAFHFTNDQGKEETINIPKEDIFYQFRKDVKERKLPTVSWLVAPQRFSDHTSSPLYGTWYVSEALNILTENPEVFKKTIFILTYDENDGYFDHQPPFVVPNPVDSSSGKVSDGIDYATDYEPKKGSPIGLGFRVPMVVASPWSRGGYVNSQVFDHTSSIMFMENWLSRKTGKTIKSNNISNWRRAVCGDLTSVFRTNKQTVIEEPKPLKRDQVIAAIGNAKNKPAQLGPTALNHVDIEKINTLESWSAGQSPFRAKQEPGTRPACALPYQMISNANLMQGRIHLSFEAPRAPFGQITENVGIPFRMSTAKKFKGVLGKTWAYAVKAGDRIPEIIDLNDFDQDQYDFSIAGPNGFYRNFRGSSHHQELAIEVYPEQNGILKNKYTGHVSLVLQNSSSKAIKVKLKDNKYGAGLLNISIDPHGVKKMVVNTAKSKQWYDFSILIAGNSLFEHRYSGKIETGAEGITDPYMAGIWT